ncbi:hypothetical protein TSAR_005896 [Trichomalopsis sarcophagae]|uniref:Uncharacterized protein n=1 Tax=Trichomalopsis sarcophagae TaxID=543379 RepID=A0A232FL37_9HYME|nr:hypothetical protein TSAR_005896 [Trichomalopsis sarcophagae]
MKSLYFLLLIACMMIAQAYGSCNFNDCSPFCQYKKCQGTRCVCDTRFIAQNEKNKANQGIINSHFG